ARPERPPGPCDGGGPGSPDLGSGGAGAGPGSPRASLRPRSRGDLAATGGAAHRAGHRQWPFGTRPWKWGRGTARSGGRPEHPALDPGSGARADPEGRRPASRRGEGPGMKTAEALSRPQDGVLAAFGLGARMLLQRPFLAGALLVATISQGALQGGLVLALRNVLIGFSDNGGVDTGSLLMGAGIIFGIWLLRAASSAGGDILSARLADSVEVSGVRTILAKLLTLSPRFFDRTSREDTGLSSYHDLKAVRDMTLAVGELVQYASRLLGLAVVAWMMSPRLAMIGLVLGPLGLLPAHWLGSKLTAAARRQRKAVA